MKAIKVLFAIFMPLFICLIIAFGISVAVFGVHNNNNNVEMAEGVVLSGDEKTIELGESFNDISIDIGAYDVTLKKTSETKTTIKYKTRDGQNLTAKVDGDELVIKQDFENFMGLFSFGWFTDIGAYVEITVPDKIYEEVKLNFNAGKATVTDLESEKLSLHVGAGEVNVNAFANEIEVGVGAGTVNLTNFTEKKCEKLDVDVSAGELNIKGYETNEFDIDVSAGSADISDLTGRGSVGVSAGGATLDMKQLNGDIEVTVSAGQANIMIPSDSSVIIEADVSAGDVRTDLGGSNEHLDDDSKRTFGSGQYRIEADTSAGNVNILKK